ncbi:MAG: hypothetical protein IKX86_05755 [Clostridia bacterium]|nr:hypothetical protein [Clostridia bacterium]
MDSSYIKNVLKYIASGVLAVVIIAYILYHITGGFTPDIDTVTAAEATAEETLSSRAVIMRNEQVVYSTTEGNVNYLKNDGDKVAAWEKVAEVFPSQNSQELFNEIVALNKRIDLLKNSNMTESERRSDTESIDKSIWAGYYEFLKYSSDGNMSAANVAKDDLLINLNKRRIITRSVLSYTSLISELTAQRDALYERLSNSEMQINTSSAGYFYSFVDGYETAFSSSNISMLTYAAFMEKKSSPAEDFSSTGFGYPVGKVVTDYIWYAACEIDKAELHYFETGKNYSVKFPQNNGATVSMYLYRILYDVDSDVAVLILRGSVIPSDFSFSRTQTVQIVRKSYTGFRIPTSSVYLLEGYNVVYTLRGTKVVMRRVEPLYEYDGYFIVAERTTKSDDPIAWLTKNDLVITRGKDLYDGKIIG